MIVQYLEPSLNPKQTIIALHGWTGKVGSMQQVANAFGLPEILWVFPQAPYPASLGGYSWFDGDKIKGWKHNASFSLIDKLIEEQFENGFEANNIFLLGFSQGASLIMEYMIRQHFSIAGIISIAGFIRDKKRFVEKIRPESKNSRVLLIHGKNDPVIYHSASEKAYKIFYKSGYKVELKTLRCKHKVPMEAKPLIEKFLTS